MRFLADVSITLFVKIINSIFAVSSDECFSFVSLFCNRLQFISLVYIAVIWIVKAPHIQKTVSFITSVNCGWV